METPIIPVGDNLPIEDLRILASVAIADRMISGIYANFGHSQQIPGNHIGFLKPGATLSLKEKEAVSLVVSEVNSCKPCLSEHTQTAIAQGFSEIEIYNLRKGYSGDIKLDAMVALAKEFSKNTDHISKDVIYDFFDAGYTKDNLVDLILVVTENSNSNGV